MKSEFFFKSIKNFTLNIYIISLSASLSHESTWFLGGPLGCKSEWGNFGIYNPKAE